MKRTSVLYIAFLLIFPLLIAGCAVVGGIFKAGVWAGVLGVIAFIAIIVWLVTKFK